jgi:hypothetical protein
MTESELFGWRTTSDFIGGPTSPASQYADAVVMELLGGGSDLITMRRIAVRLRCTASAVHQMTGSKAAFVATVTRQFGRRYRTWLQGPAGSDWARLPLNAEDVHGLRVWRALSDLAAGHARSGSTDLADVVAEVNRSEADILPWRLRVTPDDVDWAATPAVLASIRGLRDAMIDASDPLDVESARVALNHLRPQLTKRLVS